MDSNKLGGRIEPLFLSEADARAVIHGHCVLGVDAPLTVDQVDFLISRLRPQFWLAPRPDHGGGCGETRLGGAPDLPEGMAWPLRPVPTDAHQKASHWEEHHGWIARQWTKELPFEFVGQIDLSEVARDPVIGHGLPAMGRLLFFWDGAIGLLESGAHTCLVIYDDTPVTRLVRTPIPEQFADMEASWREPDPKQFAHFEAMVRNLDAANQKDAADAMREVARQSQFPDPNRRKPFVYPSRARKLEPILVLPGQNAIELTQDRELAAFAEGDETGAHYALLTGNDVGPFSSDPSKMRKTQEWLTLEARRPRLMGLPHPEQDDPRFEALPTSHFPPYPWSDAQVANASRDALGWQLLLQVSVADLAQVASEGTVYFMIEVSDLAKCDFSRVVASYQQT
jgi:Domain of unknown function (DUF1963)